MDKQKNSKVELFLCLFLGWAGGHKFYNKKIGMGILYLLTFGLFLIGWWGDLILLCLTLFRRSEESPLTKTHKIASYLIAFVCILALSSCNNKETPAAFSTEPSTTTMSTTEATYAESTAATEVTTEPVEITEATEATTTPTETTVPTVETTEPAETTVTTETITEPTKTEEIGTTYVLNTSTRKFHYESCSSADDIRESNKDYYTGTREEVIAKGYDPCGRCDP